MILDTQQAISGVVVLLITGLFGPLQSFAQQPQHYTHKQVQILMNKAANADDYQKLATHFHYQAMMFRAKAQKVIDDSSRDFGKYPMATKTVTRAAVTKRSYEDYLSKAEENASLAERYDEMLTKLGVKPALESSTIVSVKTLQNDSAGASGLAFDHAQQR